MKIVKSSVSDVRSCHYSSRLSLLLMMTVPMSQNDANNDLLMLQNYMYPLHYNNNSLQHSHVSMTTSSHASRALLDRDCSMLALSVFNSHSVVLLPSHYFSAPFCFYITTSLFKLRLPFCVFVHVQIKGNKDRRCVSKRNL